MLSVLIACITLAALTAVMHYETLRCLNIGLPLIAIPE